VAYVPVCVALPGCDLRMYEISKNQHHGTRCLVLLFIPEGAWACCDEEIKVQ